MATSDAPLNVPNVTLAVARGAASARAIVGSGFGAKQATTPTFDDFESQATGALSAGPVGNLVLNQGSGTSVQQTGRGGGKCLSHDYSVEGFPKVHKVLSGASDRGYMACWLNRGTSGTDSVWKFARMGAGAVYGGVPQVKDEYTGVEPANPSATVRTSTPETVGFPSNATYANPNSETILSPNVWHFYEFEYYTGTVGGSDLFWEVRCDGIKLVTFDGFPFLLAESERPDWICTTLTGHDPTSAYTEMLDDVYIDESRARVVLTDSAVYANATKWAIQPIESYSDTEVAYTPKRQDFAVGETAYLHLFNDSGVLVYSGSAITVEEDI